LRQVSHNFCADEIVGHLDRVVDIKDFNLPLLDEPMPPIMGQYDRQAGA